MYSRSVFRLCRNGNTQRPFVQISQGGRVLVRYRSDRGEIFFLGQRTYHPKLLLSVLFYGYATGVRSSRKIEERCLSDHFYIYLMQCYTPDHRTISDFRKNNLKAIEKYFVDIVRIFSKLGYTSVGKIYLDGTKIKGNASAKRTKDRAGFEKWLSEVEEEIATVLQEAETIDNQEDDTCKVDPEQEALQRKLSDRTYLKKKIEEALEVMKEEGKEKINLTDRDANYMKSGEAKTYVLAITVRQR